MRNDANCSDQGTAGAVAFGCCCCSGARTSTQGRVPDVAGGAAGLCLGQGRRDLPPTWCANAQQAHQHEAQARAWCGSRQDREFSAMRQGIIDVLCGAPINWSGTVKDFGVWTLPFQFPDHKSWDAAMATKPIVDEFFSVIERSGAVPLAMGETGYRQISNSKLPIITPDDMKGLKIRVVASPMCEDPGDRHGREPR
ncbi:MAG: hypothetical protein R3E68_11900 [Burkholderiaceae bacterium]